MSLAVFLTAFGGVVIGSLAVIHQTLRMRAVRNSNVITDVVAEENVANRGVVADTAGHDDVAYTDEALKAIWENRSKSAIENMAALGIKTEVALKKAAEMRETITQTEAALAKLNLYEWKIRTTVGETVTVFAKHDRMTSAIKAAARQFHGGGIILHDPHRSPRRDRDPAAPARATDLPSKAR